MYAQSCANETLREVKKAMKIDYFFEDNLLNDYK